MVWYPRAVRKPLTTKTFRPIIGPRRFLFHISTSNTTSLFGWYNGRSVPYSHFFCRQDGTIEQYVPCNKQAPANLDANRDSLSIETYGNTKWTPAMVRSMAHLAQWVHAQFGIPLVNLPDSDGGRRGFSYHRRGVDGNFPRSGPLAGRLQTGGNQRWSTARGKLCPRDENIWLCLEILKLAKGGTRGDDDELISDAGKTWLREQLVVAIAQEVKRRQDAQYVKLRDLVLQIRSDVNALPKELWDEQFARAMSDGSPGEEQPASEFLARTRLAAAMGYNVSQAMLARQQAVEALVTDLATRDAATPLTAEQVQAILEQALEEHLARVAAVIAVEPGED